MDSLIVKWRNFREIAQKNIEIAHQALENAELCAKIPPDEKLMPATSEDIKEGAILWYKDGDNGPFWLEVEEVIRPNDLFYAFMAHDGCRYGLQGALIEIEEVKR